MPDLRFRFIRWIVGRLVTPQIIGLQTGERWTNPVYILQNRSITDIALLDLVCSIHGLPAPRTSIEIGKATEPRRYMFLHRPAGWLRRNTMVTYSHYMQRMLSEPATESDMPRKVFSRATIRPTATSAPGTSRSAPTPAVRAGSEER